MLFIFQDIERHCRLAFLQPLFSGHRKWERKLEDCFGRQNRVRRLHRPENGARICRMLRSSRVLHSLVSGRCRLEVQNRRYDKVHSLPVNRRICLVCGILRSAFALLVCSGETFLFDEAFARTPESLLTLQEACLWCSTCLCFGQLRYRKECFYPIKIYVTMSVLNKNLLHGKRRVDIK